MMVAMMIMMVMMVMMAKMTKTSIELRMLSSVTLNCEVTKIVRIQVLNCQKQCLKCRKSPKLSKIVIIFKKFQNCQQLSKFQKI